jgi:PAS domain-containing protein
VTPRLHAFPSSDPEFGAFVKAAWAALAEPRSPETLQRALRGRYPVAIVTTQDELARHGSEALVWYAFRSATLTWQQEDPANRWPAWATIDDERRFLDVSEALAAIAEVPSAAMVGHRVEEFSNPADPTIREDIEALWEEFVRRGAIASTLRFNHADGRPRELAWWLEADIDGPGRHRLSVRDVER